jgi:hypothetical protein
MSARDKVPAEPRHGCGTGARKLFQIRIEVPAFDSRELLRLKRLLKSAQLRIGQGDIIGQSYNHQQWYGRDLGDPMAGFRRSVAPSTSTWPPAQLVPQTPILVGSTSDWDSRNEIARRQSAIWRQGSMSCRIVPSLRRNSDGHGRARRNRPQRGRRITGSGPARVDGKNSQPRRRSPPSTPNSTSRRSTMVLPPKPGCARRALG